MVMWRPGLDPAAVAGLASRRTYPLKSSFRPTYNMSVNLLAQVGAERARGILESSFAQFQADRSVVGLAREVRAKQGTLEKYEAAMACDRGDFAEYLALRKEVASAEKSGSQGRRRAHIAAVKESLADLAVGDVIELDAGRRRRLAARIGEAEQVLITAAVGEDIPANLAGRVVDLTEVTTP